MVSNYYVLIIMVLFSLFCKILIDYQPEEEICDKANSEYNTTCSIIDINCHSTIGGILSGSGTNCQVFIKVNNENIIEHYYFMNFRYIASFMQYMNPTNDALKYFKDHEPGLGVKVPYFIFVKEKNKELNVSCLYSENKKIIQIYSDFSNLN